MQRPPANRCDPFGIKTGRYGISRPEALPQVGLLWPFLGRVGRLRGTPGKRKAFFVEPFQGVAFGMGRVLGRCPRLVCYAPSGRAAGRRFFCAFGVKGSD